MRAAILLLLLAGLTGVASADPIQPSPRSIYADRTASSVGDTVVVLVKDVTSVVQRVDSEVRRDAQASAFGLGAILNMFFPASLDNSLRSGTQANDDATQRFESALSASVVEVLPSGVLRIEAQRNITLNGQKQWLRLAGEVRPQDLRADNAIPSDRVTNLSIDYRGPLRGKQRRGLINSVLEILF